MVNCQLEKNHISRTKWGRHDFRQSTIHYVYLYHLTFVPSYTTTKPSMPQSGKQTTFHKRNKCKQTPVSQRAAGTVRWKWNDPLSVPRRAAGRPTTRLNVAYATWRKTWSWDHVTKVTYSCLMIPYTILLTLPIRS